MIWNFIVSLNKIERSSMYGKMLCQCLKTVKISKQVRDDTVETVWKQQLSVLENQSFGIFHYNMNSFFQATNASNLTPVYAQNSMLKPCRNLINLPVCMKLWSATIEPEDFSNITQNFNSFYFTAELKLLSNCDFVSRIPEDNFLRWQGAFHW